MGGAAAIPLIQELGAVAPAALPQKPGSGGLNIPNLFGGIWKQVFANPAAQASVLALMETATPHHQALYSESKLALRIYVIRRLTEIHKTVAQDLQPQLTGLVALILGEIFGREISADTLKNAYHAGSAGGEEPVLGQVLVDIMFQSMVNETTGQPKDGMANMARLMHGALRTQLAAHMGDFVDLGIFSEAMPDAAKMHEAIEGAIGLNRMVAFAARGALTELVHLPTQRALKGTFRSTLLSEAQAATLLNSELIGQDTYTKTLESLGWPVELHGPLAEYHSRQLSEAILEKAFKTGAIDETEVTIRLRRQGFNEHSVPLIVSSWKKDVVDKPMGHLVTVAGEMYVKREIDDAELKRLLTLTGIKATDVDDWIAVYTIERSRPKHLDEAKAVELYNEDVWTLEQLRAFYVAESYPQDSSDALVALAVKKKAVVTLKAETAASKLPPAPVDAVREATAKESFRLGLIDEATFRGLLSALGIKDARQDSEVSVGKAAAAAYAKSVRQHQLADQGITVSAGTAEDAFIHALANADTLHAFYIDRGFPENEWPLYLTLMTQKQSVYLAKVAKQREKAAADAAKAAAQAAKHG